MLRCLAAVGTNFGELAQRKIALFLLVFFAELSLDLADLRGQQGPQSTAREMALGVL